MLRPEMRTGGLLLGNVFDDGQCVGRAPEVVEHACEEKSASQNVGMMRPAMGTGGLASGRRLE